MGHTRILLVLIVVGFSCAWALDNGLARTPPMGWNSWNHFSCNTSAINEQLFMEMAKAMVDSGMKDVGYEYINIDDCWLASSRAPNGSLQPDPKRFPSGIKALADYIHSLGLKFGIYEDSGNMTCGGWPGSGGHFVQDTQTFADWGVDYVKLDGCYTNVTDFKQIYTDYGKALNATGRPMVYSCSWPAYSDVYNIPVDFDYVASICNLWREWYDIRDNFTEWTGILDYQEKANLAQYAGPGHWNDPDMLEIGNGAENADEYRSMMSLWSIIAAPLIAGNDLRSMDKETLAILTAREVIEVDQDPLGKQGSRINQTGLQEVWVRELHDGSYAVALFNRADVPAAIYAYWTELGWPEGSTAYVRDLWMERDEGKFKNYFTARVLPHATWLLRVRLVQE